MSAIRVTEPTLPAALAAMRFDASVTRRHVAKDAGISEQQYGRYELGDRTPRLSTLIRLADALGYDLALIPKDTP